MPIGIALLTFFTSGGLKQMSQPRAQKEYRGWFGLEIRRTNELLTSIEDLNPAHYVASAYRIPIAEVCGTLDILVMGLEDELSSLPRKPQRWDLVYVEVIDPTPAVAIRFLVLDFAKDVHLLKRNKPGEKIKVQKRPQYPLALWKLPPRVNKRWPPPLPPAEKLKIRVTTPVTVRQFAAATALKPFRVISDLMELGIYASLDQKMTESSVRTLAKKHGIRVEFAPPSLPKGEDAEGH